LLSALWRRSCPLLLLWSRYPSLGTSLYTSAGAHRAAAGFVHPCQGCSACSRALSALFDGETLRITVSLNRCCMLNSCCMLALSTNVSRCQSGRIDGIHILMVNVTLFTRRIRACSRCGVRALLMAVAGQGKACLAPGRWTGQHEPGTDLLSRPGGVSWSALLGVRLERPGPASTPPSLAMPSVGMLS
jgi:hypothetical protein